VFGLPGSVARDPEGCGSVTGTDIRPHTQHVTGRTNLSPDADPGSDRTGVSVVRTVVPA